MSASTTRPHRSGPSPGVELSIVVPAYNESARIGSSLRQIGAYLAERPEKSEIVVVDDGSSDGTFETVVGVATELTEQTRLAVPIRVLRYERNGGKGYALKVGFAQARGERVLFTDADLSVPIAFADTMLDELDAGADAAIASRRLPGSSIDVAQPLRRQVLGGVFTLLVRALIAPVNDATCGFKAFRGEAGRRIFEQMRISDWSYDAELLFLLHSDGLRIREVPVRWEHREGTKVQPLRDGLGALLGLARIRWASLRGRYGQPNPVRPELRVWESSGLGVPQASGAPAEGAE